MAQIIKAETPSLWRNPGERSFYTQQAVAAAKRHKQSFAVVRREDDNCKTVTLDAINPNWPREIMRAVYIDKNSKRIDQ